MVDRIPNGQSTDVTSLVEAMIERGIAARATDLHFEPIDDHLLVRARIDGQLVDLETLPSNLAENIVSRLKILASLLTYRVDIPQEGSFLWRHTTASSAADETDLRVATFPTIRGERVVVRIFRSKTQLQLLDSLGLTSDQTALIRNTTSQPVGFVVVSGPAGSGKTTMLYAMIRELRDCYPGRSVITLEDPVEQRIDRVTQIQINPHGELDYERCMRSLLRHDPQVILLGEVRDRQTASVAIEAALTGHLILTTVHSGDPTETILRFLEMGIPSYQLASVLTLVCSLRLLRKKCRCCADAESQKCDACLGTGYFGRIAVAEMVPMDETIRRLILKHASATEFRDAISQHNLSFFDGAAKLLASDITDGDEIARVLGRKPSLTQSEASFDKPRGYE